uniref:Protein BZR1 homolog n=2 Tax=Lactuca sativa TaxID=4236 RepID=A0A9R1WZ95_LACSA|nr:hypothetical protein LSAT_V11C800429920 [Lactuca sativa]
MPTMGGDHQKTAEKRVVKGCIKSGKGPWVVQRTTKDGRVITRYRFPSDRERLKNRERERNRRNVARKIFSGLRTFGNYQLSKNADTIDLLKAVCEEAGWHVEEDGTIYKKNVLHDDDGGYCTCDEKMDTYMESRSKMHPQKDHDDINVTLSLTLAS